jgi:transcriptional regulator with XRE-family HTH domain
VSSPAPTALGRFIREQRQHARLSLREMARMASISNAYLSQVERGLHAPSVRVLHALADALDMPLEDFVSRAGPIGPDRVRPPGMSVEAAIRADPKLTDPEKDALLAVYRSYVAELGEPAPTKGLTAPSG